ncbi:hypothetical protein RCL_jg21332.t1 [Rhizophagus clarus]|uniref:Uncharacterized protein n=1 Tax=Rhizophagus clarus TaxID=94130 RepID=A0A8H3QUY2_9GLOM|nr:hypothetical protein RCL_jg21332.t1 [Rhizophagus clarus]
MMSCGGRRSNNRQIGFDASPIEFKKLAEQIALDVINVIFESRMILLKLQVEKKGENINSNNKREIENPPISPT